MVVTGLQYGCGFQFRYHPLFGRDTSAAIPSNNGPPGELILTAESDYRVGGMYFESWSGNWEPTMNAWEMDAFNTDEKEQEEDVMIPG